MEVGQHTYGPAHLPRLLGMMNAGRLNSMRSEIFFQMKFVIFQGCLTKQAAFYLASPPHIISSLFNQSCLLQNAILHKMLGFEISSPFFSEFTFHWFQHFSSQLWLSIWVDICILNCLHEFLRYYLTSEDKFAQVLGLHIRKKLPDILEAKWSFKI